MFFEDTNPESFKKLRREYNSISDIIDNVHMISQVGRWGAYGVCNLDLNESEMTKCQTIFNENPSRKPIKIMEILSEQLPQILPPHIKDITNTSVTTRSTIIEYAKKYPAVSKKKIIEILQNKFRININDPETEYIETWIYRIYIGDKSESTPKEILDQLLSRFDISEYDFIEAWRSKIILGDHQLSVSHVRGTIYSLTRPCINKSYLFKPLNEEAHSGIHVLDLRIDDVPLKLDRNILSGDYNVLYSNDKYTDPEFTKVRETFELTKRGLSKKYSITLFELISLFKTLGYKDINIIDNTCRADNSNVPLTQFDKDTAAKIIAETSFRKKLTRCENRVVEEVEPSSCVIAGGGNFFSIEVAEFVKENIQDFPDYEKRLSFFSELKDTEEKKEWISNEYLNLHNYYTNCAADIIIKYLKKTYQKGTDKLQKETLQFMITLFGKDITQHLKYVDTTLSGLRDIIIHKYFKGGEQDWKNKAYLICKDKKSNMRSSINSKLFYKLDKFVNKL
jgi:hypothetical protein